VKHVVLYWITIAILFISIAVFMIGVYGMYGWIEEFWGTLKLEKDKAKKPVIISAIGLAGILLTNGINHFFL